MRSFVLSILAVFAVGAIALAGDRSASPTQLQQRLSGSPLALGVAKSVDAGSAWSTCTNTATPFDAGFGDLVVYSCTGDVYVKAGNCSTTAAIGNRPVTGGQEKITLLTESEMALAFFQQDGGTGVSCYVGHLR